MNHFDFMSNKYKNIERKRNALSQLISETKDNKQREKLICLYMEYGRQCDLILGYNL